MDTIDIAFLTIHALIAVLGFVANLVITIAILKRSQNKLYFILYLAFFNIGLSTVTIPIDIMVNLINVDLTFNLCILLLCISDIFFHARIFILMCAAIQNFIAIRWPLIFRTHFNKKNYLYASVTCLVAAFMVAMVPTIGWNKGQQIYDVILNKTCSFPRIMDENYLIFLDFGVAFFIPIVIIVLALSYDIQYQLKRQKRFPASHRRKSLLRIYVIVTLLMILARIPLYLERFLTIFNPSLYCSIHGQTGTQCTTKKEYYTVAIIGDFSIVVNSVVFTLNNRIKNSVKRVFYGTKGPKAQITSPASNSSDGNTCIDKDESCKAPTRTIDYLIKKESSSEKYIYKKRSSGKNSNRTKSSSEKNTNKKNSSSDEYKSSPGKSSHGESFHSRIKLLRKSITAINAFTYLPLSRNHSLKNQPENSSQKSQYESHI